MKKLVNTSRCLVLASVIMTLLISGCGKSKSTGPSETKAQLIVKGPWKETGDQFKNLDGTLVTQTVSAGTASHIFTYKANGTFTDTAPGETTNTGTWQLLNGDTQIKFVTLYADQDFTETKTLNFVVSGDTFVLVSSTPFTATINGTITNFYGEVRTFSH